MRVLVAILISGLIFALSPRPFAATAMAAEMRTTNHKHFSRGPKRRSGSGFGRASRKFRTLVVQTPQRGVIAKSAKPLNQAAKFDLKASLACREGRLKRFGGGIAEFSNNRYPAGRKRDMSRIQGIVLGEGIYVFINEGSTACRVYSFSC
jgi:hypothetical protein